MGRKSAGDTGRRRRVSQADVASRAGVSTGIVSSVINGRDYGSIRVSDPTRDRVWAAVRDLGYVPNLAARSLASGSNQLIAVFTYLPLFPLESRDFYHDFLVGIEEGAERAGYNMLLVTGAKNDRRERAVYANGVNNLQLADGAVLLGTGEDADELGRLTRERYPFVFIGQRDPVGVDLSYVAADYLGGTRAIVSELYDLGHRRIGMVQDASWAEPVPGRRPGFLAGCTAVGLPEADRPLLTLATGREQDGAVEAVASVEALVALTVQRGITALVVETRVDATAILAAMAQAGRSVPADLSIVGLGVAGEHVAHPGLAELVIPRREMGQEAVRLLLGLLADGGDAGEGAPPVRTTVACPLDRGQTLGSPPRGGSHQP